jgi:hypothetical protein
MLDAISDFWKPSRKSTESSITADLSALKAGASVGFGFMPQILLSGKRRTVQAVNTYQFGSETLLSYVLADGSDQSVSLIIADSGTEPYLAISRRLQFAERMRMFENAELLAMIANADQKRLNVRDADSEWRQWLVPQYRKEIHGLKGRVARGDFRTFNTLPASAEVQDFTYFLLVSPNNEFAVEVEVYGDSRIELYATVYRRLSDIGEIRDARADEPTLPGLLPQTAEPVAAPAEPVLTKEAPALFQLKPMSSSEPLFPEKKPEDIVEIKTETPAVLVSSQVKVNVDSTPLPVAELDAKKKVEPEEKKPVQTHSVDNVFAIVNPKPVMDKILNSFPSTAPIAPAKPEPTKVPEPKMEQPAKPQTQPQPAETQPMTTFATFNPQATNAAPKAANAPVQDYENDTIECELRAANKIIEEAIRNEMRMSDVIRRVIGLPLAGQESVQIPVLLSKDDYKLLAIRYGMSPADEVAIKARIIDEVSDFAGTKKN